MHSTIRHALQDAVELVCIVAFVLAIMAWI
jgi:hypothetical protein